MHGRNQEVVSVIHINVISDMDVLEERKQNVIKDKLGKEPSPMPANRSSIELGTEIQTRLIGAPATGKYITFAPAIDVFLKGHFFGDIFGRDNLDFQSREIAAISAWPILRESILSYRLILPSGLIQV